MAEPRRQFTMGACIGRGGFGEVYRATMRSAGGLESHVAVKVLRADLDLEDDAVRRLRDEGRILARLNHPVILRVHDLVSLDGRLSLVMEHVDGADLGDVIGEIPLRAAMQALGAVSGALDAAWSATSDDGAALRLVHRDIKPTNIRIGRHGETKLLDFGIARAESMDREARTDSNLVVGSLPYMAPERFLERALGSTSDVFALGCVLYELVTGERFYGRAVVRQVSSISVDAARFERHLNERLRAVPRSVPEDVARLLPEMLGYEPDARLSAAALAMRCDQIADALDGPTLRMWCRERVWGPSALVRGTLDGRQLTEGSALSRAAEDTRSDPVSGHSGPVLQRSPVVTVESTSRSKTPVVTPARPPAPTAERPVPPQARTPADSTPRRIREEPPARRAWLPILVVLAVVAGFLAVVTAGVAGLSLAWLTSAPPAMTVEPVPEGVAPTQTSPEPADPPVPAVPDVAEPEDPPLAAPVPARSPAEAPAAAPASAAAPSVEELALSGSAWVDVEGGVPVELRLDAAGRSFDLPGRVPGNRTYQLYADTGAGMLRRDAYQVTLPPGTRAVLLCAPDPFSCSVRTR